MNIIISRDEAAGLGGLPLMAKKAREIIVNPRLCKGCHICISVCPHSVLKKSESVDNRGFFLPEVVDLEACRVCHLCEMQCPDFAIRVVEET